MKRNILFLLSICVLLFSCSDKDDPIKEVEKPPVETKDPFITLKKTNIDFTNEGGSESISIESNVTWTAKSSASWCTVSPSSGSKSTASITLSAPANKDYDNRSCTVTIESGNITKTITVNQGENLGLLVTQDRYELSNEESTIKVEVKANVEFEVKINDAWITRIETRGLTTSEMEFKIAKNDTYDNRDGSITISQTGGDLSSTITVYQSQENAIILSEKEVEVSDRSKTLEVVLKTNVDFEVTIQEDGKGWVSYTPTRGLREETISLNILANNSEKARSTEVYIKDKLTSLQETLTITQMGNEPGVYYVERMGTLGSMLSQIQKDTITTMTIKGEINKADFEVMKSQMPKLKYIDMKKVKCADDKIPDSALGDIPWNSYGKANKNINTIILPESVITIGKTAFYNCSGLTGNLIFPDGVTTIGDGAFLNCSGLIGNLILPNKLTEIGLQAFSGCSGFTGSLVLPDELKTIRGFAFSDCSGLEGSLTLPDKLTKIEGYTFYNCTGLRGKLIFPEGLMIIGSEAFYGSAFRGDLIIPSGVTTIGESAFESCRFTGSLILPDELTEIGQSAFSNCSGFTGDLIIPSGVTSIGRTAFKGCSGLTGNLILSDGLKTIGEGAFSGSSNFTGNLIIPDGVTAIGNSAFYNCSGLTEVTIGKNVTTIHESAFNYCSNITGVVVFPEILTSIRKESFYRCDKVEAFQFPHTTPLGYYPNMLPSGATVKVPTSAVATYKATNGWKDYNIVGY